MVMFVLFTLKIAWSSYLSCAKTSLYLPARPKIVVNMFYDKKWFTTWFSAKSKGNFLTDCSVSSLSLPLAFPLSAQTRTINDQSVRLLPGHTADLSSPLHCAAACRRGRTWKQSPWRRCSCNCAAPLNGGLVGRPEFLTDVCGISMRQSKEVQLYNLQLRQDTQKFVSRAREFIVQCKWCKPAYHPRLLTHCFMTYD